MFSKAALKYQGAKKEENLDDGNVKLISLACSEENEKALFAQMGEWTSLKQPSTSEGWEKCTWMLPLDMK